MFSGIVQAVSKKVKFEEKDYGYKLSVTVPANFTKKLKKVMIILKYLSYHTILIIIYIKLQ